MKYPRFEFSRTGEGAVSGDLPGHNLLDPAGHDQHFDTVVDGSFFSALPHETRVYVMRHGQSEGNATFTLQGRLEYPLDELGLEQAKAAAAWLADKQVDAIVSSPQRRAAVTASTVAEACGLPEPEYLPSLVEVDVGLFQGLTMTEAGSRHPEIFGQFRYRSWDGVPGAEHSPAMYARAVASWARIRDLAIHGRRCIVCVSHGGLIQWLIRSTFGVKTWLPLIPTSNCGISQFDIEPTGQGLPAFVQWSRINFKAPSVSQGARPVF